MLGLSVDFLSLIERASMRHRLRCLEQMASRLRLPVRELFDFRRGCPR